jgi:hypothetical protein
MTGLVPAIYVFLTLEYRKYQDVDARDKPKTRVALWRGHDEV